MDRMFVTRRGRETRFERTRGLLASQIVSCIAKNTFLYDIIFTFHTNFEMHFPPFSLANPSAHVHIASPQAIGRQT